MCCTKCHTSVEHWRMSDTVLLSVTVLGKYKLIKALSFFPTSYVQRILPHVSMFYLIPISLWHLFFVFLLVSCFKLLFILLVTSLVKYFFVNLKNNFSIIFHFQSNYEVFQLQSFVLQSFENWDFCFLHICLKPYIIILWQKHDVWELYVVCYSTIITCERIVCERC
jgi:hypothetical protein